MSDLECSPGFVCEIIESSEIIESKCQFVPIGLTDLKVKKPFFEDTKVFLFLHVTRERVPELNAPVKGAVQYFGLNSEILFYMDLLFTSEIYFYRVNFQSSFCILSAEPDSTTKSM